MVQMKIKTFVIIVLTFHASFQFSLSVRTYNSMFPHLNTIYGLKSQQKTGSVFQPSEHRTSRLSGIFHQRIRVRNTKDDGDDQQTVVTTAPSNVDKNLELRSTAGRNSRDKERTQGGSYSYAVRRPVIQVNQRPVLISKKIPILPLNQGSQIRPQHNSAAFVTSVETVSVGDTAVMHCSFAKTTGDYKNGHITWFKEPNLDPSRQIAKGSRVYTSDRRIRVLTLPHTAVSILLIQNVQFSDQGQYRCSMRLAKIPNQNVLLNVTQELTGYDKPHFLHDRQFSSRVINTQALALGSAKHDVSGARSGDGTGLMEQNRRPTEWALFSPQFSTQQPPLVSASKYESKHDVHNYTTQSGSPFSIRCTPFKNSEDRNVFWTGKKHDGTKILFENGAHTFWGNEMRIQQTVQDRHTGIYTCTVQHPSREPTTKTYKLIIEDRPWPIAVFLQGFNVDLLLNKLQHRTRFGESVLLRCETGGMPSAKITWFRNGALLKRRRGLRITTYKPSYREHSVISKVIIRNFLPRDQGRYSCRADNAMGFRERAVSVQGLFSYTDRRSRFRGQRRPIKKDDNDDDTNSGLGFEE